MENRANYTAVGFFIIALTLCMAVFIFYLSAGRHTKPYKHYVIYLNESVAGLNEHAPIKFNGVKIGYVSRIALNPKNIQQVKVLAKIEENIPISESTIASLKAQGITGMSYIGLEAKNRHAKPLLAKAGEKYPEIPSKLSLLVKVGDSIHDLTDNLHAISENFSRVFDDENTAAIKHTLVNIETFTTALANNASALDNTLQATNTFWPQLLKNTNSALKDIKKLTAQLNKASLEVALTMQNGRAAMQNLSQQALPSTVKTLRQIERITTDVHQLTSELKANPSMLIRGKKTSPAGPGEDE